MGSIFISLPIYTFLFPFFLFYTVVFSTPSLYIPAFKIDSGLVEAILLFLIQCFIFLFDVLPTLWPSWGIPKIRITCNEVRWPNFFILHGNDVFPWGFNTELMTTPADYSNYHDNTRLYQISSKISLVEARDRHVEKLLTRFPNYLFCVALNAEGQVKTENIFEPKWHSVVACGCVMTAYIDSKSRLVLSCSEQTVEF